MKKLLCIYLVILLTLCVFPIYSYADETLYQGYYEFIDVNGQTKAGIRIKDGQEDDGRDRIAYCYDVKYSYPTKENPNLYEGKDNRCWYTRIDNYLDSHDDITNTYGEKTKQKIAMALYAGFPNNAFGHWENSGISEDEARYMTQQMVWDITNNSCKPYKPSETISASMAKYYNEIYADCIENFEEGNYFHQGYFNMEGELKMEYYPGENCWRTEQIETFGDKGHLHFTNLPLEIRVFNYEDDTDITNDEIEIGTSFYFRSDTEPKENKNIHINYTYNMVKFYFYKFTKGGYSIIKEKPIQNLIRIEPTQKVLSTDFEISLDNGTVSQTGQSDITITEDTNPGSGESGSIPDGSVIETEEDSNIVDIIEDTNPGSGESGSIPDGSIIETEEDSNIVDIIEDTNPGSGESGSIPDGSVIETEEDSNIVDIIEDTNPGSGESGSIPDGSVIETEEDSNIVDITDDTNPSSKESSSIPDSYVTETEEESHITDKTAETDSEKTDSDTDNTVTEEDTNDTLHEIPKTGDNSEPLLYIILMLGSGLSIFAVLIWKNSYK